MLAYHYTDYDEYLSHHKMVTSTYGSLPVPTKDGCYFNGWVDESGQEVCYDEVFSSTTLTASWADDDAPPAAELIYNGHKYARYEYNITWYAAKSFCEALGGHLVTITSADEQQAVESLLNGGRNMIYYTGCTDAAHHGNWAWITGEAFSSYNNWDPQLPEPSGSERGFNFGGIVNKAIGGFKQFGEWLSNADYPDEVNAYRICNYGFICEFDSVCDHRYTSVVAPATCVKEGFTTHTCEYCGDSYIDSYVVALGHNYAYSVTKEPTTTATGTSAGVCSRCDSTTAITLPKLSTTDYTYSVVKAASCTATGTGRYVWKTTTYGKFQFDVTLPKTDHSYKSTVTASTCTAQGYTTHTCSVCGDSYKDTYTAALGHCYTYKVATAPTASADGKLTGTCSRCNSTTAITLPKLSTTDYTYSVVKAASCTATGTGRYVWKTTTYGKFQFDVTLPKANHSYKSTVTAPTCTAQGYTTHTCVCGDSYKDTYTAALGHNYIPVRGVEATCTSPEMWEWQCTRCKDSYVVEGAPALGHDFRWVIDQEATDDAPGYQHEECTRCHATCNENTAIPVLNRVCDGGDSCPGRGFSDMPAAGNWAHAGIDYCVSHGLMNGVGKGQFDPNGTLTRAMLVTVLYRVQGEPDVSGLENPFEDVPDGMWYTEPIIWAASKQVVNGTSAATFEPDAPITREQIAAILYRYAKEVEGADVSASAALDGFADAASVSAYARTPLGWASALGYIKGSNENGSLLLNPQGNATRAEVATILMRYLER